MPKNLGTGVSRAHPAKHSSRHPSKCGSIVFIFAPEAEREPLPSGGERLTTSKTGTPPLRVSRPWSLWFRLRFVFPVCHGFPVVVSQYLNLAALTVGPSQIRTCRVTASGSQPTPDIREGCCESAREFTVDLPLCADSARSGTRVGLTAFPTPALPGFHPLDWSSSVNGTMQSSDSLSVFCLPRLFHLSGILGRS